MNGMDAATSLDSDRALDDAQVARQAERIAELEVQNERLREALASRDLIWSAKVVIAAATGCGPDEAHELLIQQSQHENRKVREIAAEIVARS
jgi:AmiR/NasT family two-component response regulator